MTSIRKATPPNMVGQPNVPLQRVNDFEALIFNKGYTVIIENGIECPCKGKSGAAKTTCQSCLGLGWVFIDPIETKAIITSANSSTKYKHWSPELTGTVNVTVRDSERISLMDKITFKTKTNILSEVRPIIDTGTEKFIFTSYKVRSIRSIFIFTSDSTKLIKLPVANFSVSHENEMVIKITGVTFPTDFNDVVTIEYEYPSSYNVIDLPHDFRSAFISDNNGKNQEYSLPVQAIARKSHFLMGGATNLLGNNLLDNSSL